MLIPSVWYCYAYACSSLSRRVNANSQHYAAYSINNTKLIKKGEC